MAWTDQMVEDLIKMWGEGLTTGEIGKRLGVSKNSIVGKVHRLGLSGRPSPIKKKDGEEGIIVKEPEPKAKPEKNNHKAEKALPQKTEEKCEVKNCCNEHLKRSFNHKTSLTDLDNHTCRWPLGDPKDENFHFCGKKVKIGQTYCDEHSAVAYVKASKK